MTLLRRVYRSMNTSLYDRSVYKKRKMKKKKNGAAFGAMPPMLGCREKLWEVITAAVFYQLRQHFLRLKTALDAISGSEKDLHV